MSEREVRDALASLDGRLGDVRREQSWRAIERALDAPPARARPPRRWRWPVAVGLAAALGAVWIVVITRRPAPLAATELVAGAGHRTVYDRDGVVLTLLGPGAATVAADGGDDVVHVRVARGTLIADRAEAAPAVAITAGGNTTITRDPRFAVRVEPTTVVLGTGQRAREIVERHELVVAGATPAEATTAPTNAAAPAEPAPVPSVVPPVPAPEPSNNPVRLRARGALPRVDPLPASDDPASPPSAPRTITLPDISLDAPELYRRAEAALAVRDPAGARALLERILHEHPDDELVAAARYDLALLARADGDLAGARALLEQVLATSPSRDLRAAAARLHRQLVAPPP